MIVIGLCVITLGFSRKHCVGISVRVAGIDPARLADECLSYSFRSDVTLN